MYPGCTTDHRKVIKALCAPVEEILIQLCYYNHIYKYFNQCAFCNATPKAGSTFTYHSPDAQFVADYFNKIDNYCTQQIIYA